MLRWILRFAGFACLVFVLIPTLLYGILNTGVAALAAVAAALLLLPRLWRGPLKGRRRLRRLVAAACCVAAVYVGTVSALMARRAWFTPPPDSGNLAVIVLGGKINGDQPSLMLRYRLDRAAGYLATNIDAVCVVSGGQGSDEDYPEAEVMYRYLVEAGIDPQRILRETRSENTRQNLRYSRALLDGIDTAVIATDGFHQLRASLFAADEGLTTYNLSSRTPWGLLPSYWLREILGVSWAWVSIRMGLA